MITASRTDPKMIEQYLITRFVRSVSVSRIQKRLITLNKFPLHAIGFITRHSIAHQICFEVTGRIFQNHVRLDYFGHSAIRPYCRQDLRV